MDANKRIRAVEDIHPIRNDVPEDGGDVADRISGLPNEILCHILSLLPTKEAIATSVLSTRYKDLFPLTHNLKLVLYDTRTPNEPALNSITNFTNFMNRLIRLNFHSVQSLSLACQVIRDGRQIADWVGFFLPLNLESLNLRVSHLTSPRSLGDRLVGCGLKSLVLCIEATSYVDEYTFSLPNLKKLTAIMTPFAIVNAVIKGSPLLEILSVINCSGDINENLIIRAPLLWDLQIINSVPNFSGALELNAPNLTKIVYRGFLDQGYVLEKMNSIDHAQLEVHPNIIQLPSEANEQAMRLLLACCDAQMMWFSELLVTAVVNYVPALPRFPNLHAVAVQNMDINAWALMIKLVKCAPRLFAFCVKGGIDSSFIGKTIRPNNSTAVNVMQRGDGVFILTIQSPAAPADGEVALG